MTKSQKFLSDLVSYTKYARYNGTRRETFNEIVMRNAQMHIDKYPELEEEILNVYAHYVLSRKILPSMRSMQFAGKPIELNPSRMFNCAYLPVDNIKAFNEIVFLLLGGTGVGYSVQPRHTNLLPPISKPHGEVRYLIQDSAIGWADAVQRLFKAYFSGSPMPRFDYSDIRPKGQKLVTSGGTAPGPEPLERSLTNVERILRSKQIGDQLQPIEITDIVGHLCDAVLSGGIRRSATIALFDVDDEEMLFSKSGDWSIENGQRARANISAVLDRRKLDKKTFNKVFDALQYSESGEPGFFFTNDPDWGVNPCGEIGLQAFGMCNLVEVNIGDDISNQEFLDRCRAASFIGTLQAGYTDFHYLRPKWRERAVADALVGISLTGIASGNYRDLDLAHGALVARRENERVADKIGIRPAKRLTTVKPSGTASLVLGTSSGVHPYWARYQIRNIEVSTIEPLYRFLLAKAPQWVRLKRGESATALFSVPLKNPENGAYRDETALEALERIRYIQEHWISPGHFVGLNKNNVSATVSVRDSEWAEVREWMWTYRHTFSGLTLFPYWGGSHPDAPNVEITKEEYEELIKDFPDLDLTEIDETEDLTNLTGEISCGGGACEL